MLQSLQCLQSSFYTVNKDTLLGYYMACCGLTDIPPSTTRPSLEASKPSLMTRLEHCRHSGYQVIFFCLAEKSQLKELIFVKGHIFQSRVSPFEFGNQNLLSFWWRLCKRQSAKKENFPATVLYVFVITFLLISWQCLFPYVPSY